MNRRRFLRRIGICTGVGAVGGCLSRAAQHLTPVVGNPPEGTEWTLEFEDTFDSGALNGDNWGIGWGWGQNTSISDTRMDERNVTISDGRLRLRGTHQGDDIRSGGINSKDRVTFGPGSHLEARIKFADREGFHNAFWSKPNTEAWPPEIDVVEQWHEADSVDPTQQSHHHLHYSSSGEPGDDTTYEDIGIAYEHDDDVTQNFHVYGVEWRSDRIVHYVDGDPVQSWTEPEMLTAMERGAPFYIMVNLNIGSVGTPAMDEEWGEEMIVDWVRLWSTTAQPDDRRYLWARSSSDEPARFAFRTTGGNIELDTENPSVDYWVSTDGTTAGGTVPRASSLPGFWFDGEISDFAYEGTLDLYVDDAVVDPDTLVDESTPGPPIVDP